mgnify:CR=1 FL=1
MQPIPDREQREGELTNQACVCVWHGMAWCGWLRSQLWECTGSCAESCMLWCDVVMQVINDIRNRTGARVNLFDEEKNCGDRMLQVRHRCAAVVTTL